MTKKKKPELITHHYTIDGKVLTQAEVLATAEGKRYVLLNAAVGELAGTIVDVYNPLRRIYSNEASQEALDKRRRAERHYDAIERPSKTIRFAVHSAG